jgi:hypothetical protein
MIILPLIRFIRRWLKNRDADRRQQGSVNR